MKGARQRQTNPLGTLLSLVHFAAQHGAYLSGPACARLLPAKGRLSRERVRAAQEKGQLYSSKVIFAVPGMQTLWKRVHGKNQESSFCFCLAQDCKSVGTSFLVARESDPVLSQADTCP